MFSSFIDLPLAPGGLTGADDPITLTPLDVYDVQQALTQRCPNDHQPPNS